MKRSAAVFFLFLFSGISAISQDLVGSFRQNYFSLRGEYYSNVYSVATPAHKDGAILIRTHGKTVIDIIYIVVDRADLSAFTNAFESCRIQYLSTETITGNYFPPVSVMWRDREHHAWVEASEYLLNPYVFYDENKGYFALSGNAVSDTDPEQESGIFFLMLDGPSEFNSVMKILRSDKLRRAVAHAKMELHPFE